MARPRKKGLSYYPKDVDFYDDIKIIRLSDKYGPLGLCIYEIILATVYKEGYYLEIPLETLAFKVQRTLGNKWVKSTDLVIEVILFCADIGLFSHDLVCKSVITSHGLQKRYSEATVRNKVDKSKYWLCDGSEFFENENDEPYLSEPFFSVSATKTPVSATKTPVSVAEMQQSKVNKIKENKKKVDVVGNSNDIASNNVENNVEKLDVIGGIGQGVVFLTENQIQSILDLVGIDGFEYYVGKIADCVINKHYNVRSHYKTIIKWIQEDSQCDKC